MSGSAVSIRIPDGETVSGIWLKPTGAKACLVLAHGAGAGMAHKSMAATADGLAERKIATLRFNFPYMERGSKRPDSPAIAEAAVRAAAMHAAKLGRGLPMFAGGRSFGGRMTSGAQARAPLEGVIGLVFFAFPLHPAGKPGVERAKHLEDVKVPMLFLSGSRDPLAELELLKPAVKKLGKRAKLALAEDADHSFHVPAKTGRKDPEVFAELLDAARDWMLAKSG
jgi:predicted alpha/beta-hydrolase family hydrolase